MNTTLPGPWALGQAMRESYGTDMCIAGMGAAIPLCSTLAYLYPEAEMLLIGLSEPDANVHAVDESVSPDELARLATAEAIFLARYGSP